jgi:hypothetical protein
VSAGTPLSSGGLEAERPHQQLNETVVERLVNVAPRAFDKLKHVVDEILVE